MAKKKKNKELRHPWLDANDPANSQTLGYRSGPPGFWVPTPYEIEHQCELAKERSPKVSNEQLDWYPPVVDMPIELRKAPEEIQLCDCPYWGTEFRDCSYPEETNG